MRFCVLALLFVIMTASAQIVIPGPSNPGPLISQELRQFLDLTNDQAAAILRLNGDYLRFQLEKSRRAAQVRAEIYQETQKETLDAMALGLRYLELEVIQREVTAKGRETAAEVQKLFTPAQKTKLQSLEQVLQTYPIACEAASLSFLTPQPTRWFDTGTFNPGTGITGSLIFGLNNITYSCGIVPAIRTGDFQP